MGVRLIYIYYMVVKLIHTYYMVAKLIYTYYVVAKLKVTVNSCWNYLKSKVSDRSQGWQKTPFLIATTPRCRGGHYSFPWFLYFTLEHYLIMLSVKQGGIKYHFLSLWYGSTGDWTLIPWAIGKYSNHDANVWYLILLKLYKILNGYFICILMLNQYTVQKWILPSSHIREICNAGWNQTAI